MVLDAEVVHHQDESDGARGVAEKTGGVGLVKVEGLEEGDKTEVGKLTRFFKAVHSFIYPKSNVVLDPDDDQRTLHTKLNIISLLYDAC